MADIYTLKLTPFSEGSQFPFRDYLSKERLQVFQAYLDVL